MTLLTLLLCLSQPETIPAPAPAFADTGRVITLPGGTVTLVSPLTIEDRDDALIDGNNTTILYAGPPTKSVVTLARCNHGTVKNLSLVCTVPGVEYGVLLTNLPPPSPTGRVSRACLVENVRVMHGGYPTAVGKAFACDSTANGGVDANNDHHCFRRCYAQSYREAAYYTHGTQVHQIVYEQCHATNGRNYLPRSQWPIGWLTGDGAYLTLRDCFSGSNDTDISIGNRAQNIQIDGFNSEHARRAIVVSHDRQAEFNFSVRNGRWDMEPERGVDAIDLWGPGLWRFESCWFAGINGVCPTLKATWWHTRPDPARPWEALPGDVSVTGVVFRQHGGPVPTKPILVCPTTWGQTTAAKWQRINADGSWTTKPAKFNKVP